MPPSISGLLGGLGGGSGSALGTLYVRLAADSSLLIKGMQDGEKSVKYGSLAIVGALAAVGVAAVREFAKFDKAMTDALSIMGDVSDEMKKQMSDTARTIALDSVKSAEDMANSYFFMASAGLTAQQSMKALPALTSFATAGNFKMARATDLLVDAQAALGLRTDDVTQNLTNMVRVSDAIIKGNIQSATTVEQLSEALTNKAAAALRLVNKEVEEGVAVLGVYAQQGLKGAAAGEALAIVLRDLQRAALEQPKIFEQLGIKVYDTSGNMRNMADILEELEGALRGASDEEKRLGLMMLGFQDRTVSSLLALIGFSDQIRAFEKELRAAGGATEEVASKQLTSFSAQMEITVNRVKDLLITIGEGLRPALDELNAMVREATSLNTAANESWKESARIIGTVLVGAVKVLVAIWEGWRDLLKLVAIAMLAVLEQQVKQWLAGFDLMAWVFNKFIEVVMSGVNNLIKGINALILLFPELTKGMGLIRPLKFDFDMKSLIDRDKVLEWIEVLKLAREEIDESLVKTVMGAAAPIEVATVDITESVKNMTVTIGKDVTEAGKQVSQLKTLIASTKVEAALKEIGLPDRRYVGSDPFMGQFQQNDVEVQAVQSKLKQLEELGKQEVELTKEVQAQKAAAIEAYSKRLGELQLAQTQLVLQSAQAGFDEMANAARAWAGEQSEIYMAMFVASKAFAIADATVKIFQGIAAAASLTWPANLVAMASVIAATGSLISSMSAVTLTLSGKKATGGGVRGNEPYLIGERGPEIFTPSSNGTITPNNRIGGDVKVVINNYSDAEATQTERMEGDRRVVEVVIRRLRTEMAAEIREGRGDMTRAMEQSYGLKRGKGQ